MWTICDELSYDPVAGTEDIQGNHDACVRWLEENQVFYDENNPSPVTNEPFGSKYMLFDLTDHLKKVEELMVNPSVIDVTIEEG